MLRLHKKKAQTLRSFDSTQDRTLSAVERVRLSSGQSTVEYVLLVTAVIVVILVVTKGSVTSKLTSTLNNTTEKIDTKVTDLDTSQQGTKPGNVSAANARVRQHLEDNKVNILNPGTTIP